MVSFLIHLKFSNFNHKGRANIKFIIKYLVLVKM